MVLKGNSGLLNSRFLFVGLVLRKLVAKTKAKTKSIWKTKVNSGR